MRIGIIDADLIDKGTRHPNVALMKISAYYKSKGDVVELIYEGYDTIEQFDKIFISKVFSFTRVPEGVIEKENVEYGGTGFFEDGGPCLPEEIEKHMPDYNLYTEFIENEIQKGKSRNRYSDYLDYSIGFATRGCFRKCDFCVNKKFDAAFRHSKISEFLDEKRPKIYLWDDNILSFPKWNEVLDELEATGKYFQFRQGLDLRLMDDKKAKRLNELKYYGDFIFAFDHLKDKEVIVKRIQLWKKYTNKNPKLYVISGFGSQDVHDIEDVFERVVTLMEYGCIPYIMRHEDYIKSEYKGIYVQLARWCNQPQFLKKMSFREFCVRNQFYHTTEDTICASLKAMQDFERDHPEIAKKYFDKKFENENIYNMSYGVGRKYFNKPQCSVCKKKNASWKRFFEGTMNDEIFSGLYFNGELDLNCLGYKNSECELDVGSFGRFLFNKLLDLDNQLIFIAIKSSFDVNEMVSKSRKVVIKGNQQYYYDVLKKIFLRDHEKKVILSEFAGKDNLKHLKNDLLVLANLDLIKLSSLNSNAIAELTSLGSEYIKAKEESRNVVWDKLLFRIPFIQKQKYYELNCEVQNH